MTREIQRVLKPGGVYMAISYGSPDSRNYHFDRKHLTWDYLELQIPTAGASIHYIYICTKQEGWQEAVETHFANVIEELEKEDQE